MSNCRWLLCLVVIGLATRGVSSMNDEQSRSRNDSSKSTGNVPSFALNTNLEGKKKPHHEPTARERDQVLFSSTESLAAPTIPANLTSSNGTVPLADSGASTSRNAAAKLSHSKRHFHRSKLYRKESRTKSRASIRSNVGSGNMIPFSTGHNVVSSLDLVHNSNHNNDRDGIKLIDPTSRTSIGTKTNAATSRNDSIPTNSSRMTAGSENWDNSSTSSDSGSNADEKSSSVELMAFTFENVEEVHQPTLPNDLEKRLKNLTQSSSSIAVDRSSTIPSSDKSVVKSESTAADLTKDRIDRGQSIQTAKRGFDDYAIIYSVHTDKSRDGGRKENELVSTSVRRDGDNMTKDDSVILASVASKSSASNKSMNAESDNESNATNFRGNLNHSLPDADGSYSWVSSDDSLNRISLTEVAETLKKVASRESRSFYSYSNSTVSNDTDHPESAKHYRSLTPGPGVDKNPREARPSIISKPEIKSADHSHASSSVGKFDHPLKFVIPLNLGAIVKSRMKKDLAAKDGGLLRSSTSEDSMPRKRSSEEKDSGRKDEPVKLVLDQSPSPSQCSSSSSTERSLHVRRRDDQNPFYQRRSDDVTLAVSGNSVSETEQCLTTEAIVSPVIPPNPEEKEVVATIPAIKSHARKAKDTESSPSTSEENRGGQSLLSPSIIVLGSFEPIVLESLASEEAVAAVEAETTTSGHYFTVFPDLKEHCNASSFNVFIPFVNSRETVVSEEEPRAEIQLNRTSTEDTIYIMEGFGFFKDSLDESVEIEDELDRRRDAPVDYAETEVYPGYPQIDDHPPVSVLKITDQINYAAELPARQEPLIAADFRWNGNAGDRSYDSWWLNDESKQRGGLARKNEDSDQRDVVILSGFATPKKVPGVQSLVDNALPQMTDLEDNGYRIFLLPTVYVFTGICVVVIGCSIWCSRLMVKRQPKLPKLTYFIQQRQGAAETV